jgi:Flp pilus assembly protein TadG
MRSAPSKRAAVKGQSIIEFALILPLALALVLGVVEVGYALLDQHVVTKLAREGANLISRDSTLEDAVLALSTMNNRPLNFANGSKVIFSVIKRGATTGTNNYDRLILYQRHEYGNYSGQSAVVTAGGGSFGGAPNYQAANSDSNTNLQVTNLPTNLVAARGGMIYVTEIFTRHDLITPFDRLGVRVPTTLYSIAYF